MRGEQKQNVETVDETVPSSAEVYLLSAHCMPGAVLERGRQQLTGRAGPCSGGHGWKVHAGSVLGAVWEEASRGPA